VAASVIRTFTFEAFTIPTPSMEKSMLVGDYLFVSKLSYGPKIPQTPMSVPFMHNALPGGMTNSSVEWFSLPYFRLPGFGKVERYDPVVFNFPNGDTILVDPFFAGHDYHMYLREEGIRIAKSTDAYFADQEKFNTLARSNFNDKHICISCGQGKPYPIQGTRYRPMDKKENYVKRCIGLPGDNLSIVHGQVMIDGNPAENPQEMMLSYQFAVKSKSALSEIYKKYHVNKKDRQSQQIVADTIVAISSFTAAEYAELSSNSQVYYIQQVEDTLASPNLQMYPNSSLDVFKDWTIDNYGPIHIPKQGETISLTPENIALYTRVIRDYELNQVALQNGQLIINGQPVTEYTFKQNYYFMMGDNRHQSLDSRYWGFVPEDHIVGKPVFTWFSRSNLEYQEDTSIRWRRMFRFVD
ncbi:MAG: signal peptidase I, partial [Flavobacteriales bacterium]